MSEDLRRALAEMESAEKQLRQEIKAVRKILADSATAEQRDNRRRRVAS